MGELSFYLWAGLAAIAYAGSTLLSKRALDEGAASMHMACAAGAGHLVMFLPVLLVRGFSVDWSYTPWLLAASVTASAGFVVSFVAIRFGQVSVHVPVQGSKAIFVALVASLGFGDAIPPGWWAAAILAALGFLLLGRRDLHADSKHLTAIALAMCGSLLFGTSDVILQKYGNAFGQEAFIVLVLSAVTVVTLVATPVMLKRDRLVPPRKCVGWMLGGGGLMGAQGVVIALTIVNADDNVTAINIVYASRGIWAVMMVWVLGSLVGSRERETVTRGLLATRLFAAAIIAAAVGLVIATTPKTPTTNTNEREPARETQP